MYRPGLLMLLNYSLYFSNWKIMSLIPEKKDAFKLSGQLYKKQNFVGSAHCVLTRE